MALGLIVVAVGSGEDRKATWQRDLVFGKGGDQELKLDLVAPDGPGPFPGLVIVHGGGWRAGSYKDAIMQTLAERLALRGQGYVAASIQYRLTPKARFPSQIEDCKCAVRWLRENAVKLKIDPDRIGAMGGSAGGHLVLLLGVTVADDGLEGKGDLTPQQAAQSSAVKAVVNLFGPSDLEHGDWDKRVEPLIVDLLGGPLKEKAELAKQASPLAFVRKSPMPAPILTFHGTDDDIVPYIHATKMHSALKKIGATEELVTMQGDKHGWGGKKLDDTISRTVAFFDKHLAKPKTAQAAPPITP